MGKTRSQTQTKILKFKLDPTQGAAHLATSIAAPKGYHFAKMERKGSDVTITYVRPDCPRRARLTECPLRTDKEG